MKVTAMPADNELLLHCSYSSEGSMSANGKATLTRAVFHHTVSGAPRVTVFCDLTGYDRFDACSKGGMVEEAIVTLAIEQPVFRSALPTS
jgi:hypothetical protein